MAKLMDSSSGQVIQAAEETSSPDNYIEQVGEDEKEGNSVSAHKNQSRLDIYYYNWACSLNMLAAVAIEQLLLESPTSQTSGELFNNVLNTYNDSCTKFKVSIKLHGAVLNVCMYIVRSQMFKSAILSLYYFCRETLGHCFE